MFLVCAVIGTLGAFSWRIQLAVLAFYHNWSEFYTVLKPRAVKGRTVPGPLSFGVGRSSPVPRGTGQGVASPGDLGAPDPERWLPGRWGSEHVPVSEFAQVPWTMSRASC